MESATKKGRPPVWSESAYALYDDVEKRVAQNKLYAGLIAIRLLGQKPGDFFIKEKGDFRRQGIAEKIGRLYYAGKLTAEEAKELAERTIDLYNNGLKVKEIEKAIDQYAKEYL